MDYQTVLNISRSFMALFWIVYIVVNFRRSRSGKKYKTTRAGWWLVGAFIPGILAFSLYGYHHFSHGKDSFIAFFFESLTVPVAVFGLIYILSYLPVFDGYFEKESEDVVDDEI